MLEKALDDAGERVRYVTTIAHSILDRAGCYHALAGRVAARAYGCRLPIERVDFVVLDGDWLNDEAQLRQLPPGASAGIRGMPVRHFGLGFRFRSSDVIRGSCDPDVPGIFRIEPLALICLRDRDPDAVVALLRVGADYDEVRWLVSQLAPWQNANFARLAEVARTGAAIR